MTDRLETFDDQLSVWMQLNNIEFPAWFIDQLRQASTSERVELLRARGIYNLPYNREVLD